MTRFDLRAADLRALNSLTKYPSIPTYQELDPRNGVLLESATARPVARRASSSARPTAR